MLNRLRAFSGCAISLITISCSMGSGKPTHHDSGGSGGKSTDASDAGANIGGNDGGDSRIEAPPPSCGTFEIGADNRFETATFRGLAWTDRNPESTIELYGVDETHFCARGNVVRPEASWGWAILGLANRAVLHSMTDTTTGQPTQVVTRNSAVPRTEGLVVDINNKNDTDLWICLQGTNYSQWCAKEWKSGTLIRWTDFTDQSAFGLTYAMEPLISIQITVPNLEEPGAFDFCVESVVEAAPWCECSSGKCQCPSGMTACHGTCVSDTATNPDHCGNCDTTCSSTAACRNGQCIDSTVKDLVTPNSVAVNDTDIYFTETNLGIVMRAPLGGEAPLSIATEQTAPTRIVTVGKNVYWVNAGTSAKNYSDGRIMTLVDGVPTILADNQNNVVALAANASSVFWANAGTTLNGYLDGAIMKLDLMTGSTPTTLAGDRTHPRSLALDATNVYWVDQGSSTWGKPANDGTVMKLPFDGKTPESIASNLPSPMSIAVDAINVYVGTANVVYQIALSDRISKTLASGQSWPFTLVADSTYVYWTNDFDGSLVRASTSGELKLETLARGRHWALGLAVNSTHIYWTTQDATGTGSILKTAK